MHTANFISGFALLVSLGVAAFTVYQYVQSRRAKLEFKMSIGRSYEFVRGGPRRGEILSERNPTTRLLIRNMSSRPSALVEIRAKNPLGSVLMDVEGQPPGGQMPLRIGPWGVEIIDTEWPAGDHTEGLFFLVTDIDDQKHEVHDYTRNSRVPIGSNVFESIEARRKAT